MKLVMASRDSLRTADIHMSPVQRNGTRVSVGEGLRSGRIVLRAAHVRAPGGIRRFAARRKVSNLIEIVVTNGS